MFKNRKLFSIFNIYDRHREKAKKGEESYDATASRTISVSSKKGTRDKTGGSSN